MSVLAPLSKVKKESKVHHSEYIRIENKPRSVGPQAKDKLTNKSNLFDDVNIKDRAIVKEVRKFIRIWADSIPNV